MSCSQPQITFSLNGRPCTTSGGLTIAQGLVAAGVMIDSSCGGRGTCGRCAVRVLEACPDPCDADCRAMQPDQLAEGWRLACQHDLVEGMSIAVADSDAQEIFSDHGAKSAPTFSFEQWPPDGWLAADSGSLGIALDIGTTSMAAYLVELSTGDLLRAATMVNPQMSFGADVVSRLTAASGGRASLLRGAVISGLDRMVESLLEGLDIEPDQVTAITAVGNTAMHHFFLGLPVEDLGMAPYRPVTAEARMLRGSELGLRTIPNARVFCPPLVWGFVGSDITAGMLATSLGSQEGVSLLVDMGTNSEIVASVDGRMVACAAAAGPAFEGAHTSSGMRAAPGAVTRVRLLPETQWDVLGDARPRGMTGSGLLDLLAEALRLGLVDSSGRIDSEPPDRDLARFVTRRPSGELAIDIIPGIGLTQRDVRQLQLAKGAICSGIVTVLDHIGLTPDQVDRLFLAGAFGNHMDPASAIRVGLFPGIEARNVVPAGNAAGSGALLTLLSSAARDRLEQYRERTEYLELATVDGFQDTFISSLGFPSV